MDFSVNISLVLYKNDKDLVVNCINSCLKYIGLNILYIIDNSPTDIFKNISNNRKIHYVHNPANPGFGASHNIAINNSITNQIKYHLVVNPDIFFDEGTIDNIVNFMELHSEVSHLMPKVLYPNHEFQYLCKKNPTIFDLFARGFLPKKIKIFFQSRLDKYEYKTHDLNSIIYDIPYLSGCFMFFRTSIFNEVGIFDDNFFMYLEDADITRRILKVSKTVYYPKATVFHYYSGLTHKKWKFKLITIKSAIIYFNKWGWFNSII